MSSPPVVELGVAPTDDTIPTVERVRDQCQLPGIAVAVVNGDGLGYFLGLGWSDEERDLPVTPDTVFRIGSATKTLTALTVLRAAPDVIDVSLNDSLVDLRVDPPSDWPCPTVEHVLTHTSGIRSPVATPGPRTTEVAASELARPPGQPRPPLATLMPPVLTTAFRAGSRYEYSNWAFGLLEAVLGHRRGSAYETLVVEAILSPLAMTNTHLAWDAPSAQVAVGYDAPGAPSPYALWQIVIPAAGGMWSTARDMSRYSVGLFDVFATEARAMGIPRVPAGFTAPLPATIGLAWRLSTIGGSRVMWHTGGFPGWSFAQWLSIEHRVAVLVFANRLSTESAELLRIKLPGYLMTRLLGHPRGTPLHATELNRDES